MALPPPSRFEIFEDIRKLEQMCTRHEEEVDKMDIDIRFYNKEGGLMDGVRLEKIIVEQAPRIFQGAKHAALIAFNSRKSMQEENENG